MHSEDYSARYTAFLRSGSYPAVSALLTKRNDWSRYAGLLALAGAAGSAGYMTTLWLVPMPGVETAPIHASVASMAAPPTQVPPAALPPTAAELTDSQLAIAPEPAPKTLRREPAPRVARAGAALRSAPEHVSHDSAPQLTAALKPAKAIQPVAGAALHDAHAAHAAHEAHETTDTSELDDLRAELEAERARMHEEARRSEAAATAPVVQRPASIAYAPLPVQPSAARPQPAKVWPLMAAANLDQLQVKGPLGMSSVRRGVERLRPALASCYASMAQRAGHNHFGHVDVTLVIDETGRVRSPRVAGGLLPGLDACLAGVASKLVTSAPDTGTATATLMLNFTP